MGIEDLVGWWRKEVHDDDGRWEPHLVEFTWTCTWKPGVTWLCRRSSDSLLPPFHRTLGWIVGHFGKIHLVEDM